MADNTSPPAPNAASVRLSDVSARLQHLHNRLTSERHGSAESRRAMEALDREMRDMSAEPISARLERRRRDLEAQIHDARPLPETPPTSSPSALLRSRRRVVRPSERLLRHRNRLNQAAQTDGAEHTSTSPMSERPPPPIEPSEVAIQEYLDEAQVNRENRWRAKRRKLDDGTFEEDGKTFSYGHKGQVVTGPLRMEIISCDGGAYSEPNVGSSMPQHVLQDDTSVYCTKSNQCNLLLKHVGGMPISLTKVVIKAPDTGYDAPIQEGMIFVAMDDDNILERTNQYEIRYSPKNYRYHYRRAEAPHRMIPSREYLNSARSPLRSIDRSAYLRDPDPPQQPNETDRLLETALIPGFAVTTSFDSRSDDDDVPPQASPIPLYRVPEFDLSPAQLLASYESYRPTDSYRPNYVRPPVRVPFDQSDIPRSADSINSIADENDNDDHDDNASSGSDTSNLEDEDYTAPSQNPNNAPSWRPVSRHGPVDPSNHDMDAARVGERRFTDRMLMEQVRNSRPRRAWDRWTREYLRMETDETSSQPLPTNRRSTPSRIEVRSSAGESRGMGTETRSDAAEAVVSVSSHTVAPAMMTTPTKASSSSEPPPLAPHARFFIRRDKSSVSIKFDPPVAGRYILIKLWAPCPNANIDIQSIVAYGYGGPRFFPSQEVR